MDTPHLSNPERTPHARHQLGYSLLYSILLQTPMAQASPGHGLHDAGDLVLVIAYRYT